MMQMQWQYTQVYVVPIACNMGVWCTYVRNMGVWCTYVCNMGVRCTYVRTYVTWVYGNMGANGLCKRKPYNEHWEALGGGEAREVEKEALGRRRG